MIEIDPIEAARRDAEARIARERRQGFAILAVAGLALLVGGAWFAGMFENRAERARLEAEKVACAELRDAIGRKPIGEQIADFCSCGELDRQACVSDLARRLLAAEAAAERQAARGAASAAQVALRRGECAARWRGDARARIICLSKAFDD